MTEPDVRRRRDRFFAGLTRQEILNLTSSLLLPLMLGIFTIVITVHQANVAQKQRVEDRHLAREEREQDLNLSRVLREQDLDISAQQRSEDREQARLQRELDKEIARNQSQALEDQRRHELLITQKQYQDNLLTDYIRDVGVLLKENNGSLTRDSLMRTLVRTKTLAALRQLDSSRSAEVIRFLYEAEQLSTNNNPIDLSGAQLNNVDFSEHFQRSMSGLSLAGAHLENASFAHSKLSNIDFRESNLTGTNFAFTSLRACRFDRAYMQDTHFAHAHIRNTRFNQATMLDTEFVNATLNMANFSSADLQAISFGNATLLGVTFANTQPRKLDFDHAYLVAVSFFSAMLKEIHFEYTRGYGLFFVDTFIFDSPFRNVQFSNSYFRCFGNCHYHQLVFNNSAVTNSTFAETKLTSPTFINSDLSYGDFTGTSLTNARFINTTMRYSNGKHLDFTSARLINSDLDNSNLMEANVGSAVFTRCSMNSVDFRGAQLLNTWFTSSRLENAVFTGSTLNGANLSNSDLFHAEITELQLASAISIRSARLPNGTYAKRDDNLITNGHADCRMPLQWTWNIEERDSVAVVRAENGSNNCVFAPNRTNGPVRFSQKISGKYKQTRWDLRPVLLLTARLSGASTTITIGYLGQTASMNSNNSKPIRFPLTESMVSEPIRVTVFFDPSTDNSTASWCDDIRVTVEVSGDLV